jgi:hypothetical protein
MDIKYLLYNTTIEEYVDILDDVYRMYKQGIIDYEMFNFFLFQDYNVSNSVAKNYQNEKLIDFFDMLLLDEELINLYPEWSMASIKESILNLLKGNSWHGKGEGYGLKRLSEIQPPILDTLQIDCP